MLVGNQIKRILLGVMLVALATPVYAQQQLPMFNNPDNVAGNTAFRNLQNIGLRSPGRLVDAGRIRFQNAIRPPLANFDITETSRPLNIRQQFTIDAIEIISEQLNAFISAFEILLQMRAGQPADMDGDMMADDNDGMVDDGTDTGDDGTDDGTADDGDTVDSDDGGPFIPDRGDLGRPDSRRVNTAAFHVYSADTPPGRTK